MPAVRVVVIGPYPPTADPAGDLVLDAVRRLRADGAVVTVVSPEPSAAPAHGDPARWWGAASVARVVRGADRVVWFAADGVRPRPPLRRALARVGAVERRAVGGGGPEVDAPPSEGGVRARVRRVQAGLPTFARTTGARLRSRAARARSGRRS